MVQENATIGHFEVLTLLCYQQKFKWVGRLDKAIPTTRVSSIELDVVLKFDLSFEMLRNELAILVEAGP